MMASTTTRFVVLLSLLPGCLATVDLGDPEQASTGAASVPTASASDAETGAASDTEGDSSGDAGGETEGSALPEPDADLEDVSEALARLRCEALFACDCWSPEDADAIGGLEGCIESFTTTWIDRGRAAEALGLQVDPGCYQRSAAVLGAQDCEVAPPASFFEVEEAWACAMWVGDAAAGEACERSTEGFRFDSSCAPGLSCAQGVCVELPTAGDCLPETVDVPRCAPPGVCVDDLCHVRTPAGFACSDSFECAVTLRCGDAGVCEPAFNEGEACSNGLDCVSGWCVEGVCTAPRPAVCGPILTEEGG
ncbi:MAG: hypothetical protein AAGA54_15980 [Myxococcota bacterium]